MIPIPDSAEDVTADWLTAALQREGVIACRIAGLEATHIGEGVGFLSSMLHCRLQYDAPTGNEPPSVVVKLEPRSETQREVIEFSHGFEREICFYREMAPLIPVRVPRFYHGDFDAHRAVIVLEDLSHLTARNQVHGLPNAETLRAVRQVARMHARFWNDDTLAGLKWIPLHDERLTLGFAENWDNFEDVYGLRIGQDAVALGRRLCGLLDWLGAEITTRPHTICHGDFRADNIFFGDPGGPDEVVVLDWQETTRTIGALDLSRLLGGSEPPAERRSHPMEVFTAWHETLQYEGVANYSAEAALQDLRLGVLLNLCAPVRILGNEGADPGGRGGQLLDVIATRMFALAMEVDAAARLP